MKLTPDLFQILLVGGLGWIRIPTINIRKELKRGLYIYRTKTG
jgi:hypothetical protein